MVTRNCSLRAPLMRLPGRNQFRRKTEILFLPHFSHIYLRHFFWFLNEKPMRIINIFFFFFFCPSSSVIFSLEIYIYSWVNKKKAGCNNNNNSCLLLRRSEPATFHKTDESIVKVIDDRLLYNVHLLHFERSVKPIFAKYNWLINLYWLIDMYIIWYYLCANHHVANNWQLVLSWLVTAFSRSFF